MQGTIRIPRLVLVAAIALAAVPGPLAADEVIDRVLAIVSGNVITLSEARAALDLGLVDAAAGVDPIAVAVRALIERELVLEEISRSVISEPTEAAVTERVARIRARFADAGTYRKVLARSGLDEAGLQGVARDDVRVREYIDRRFEAVLPPSDEEVLDYYRSHQEQFTQNGEFLPLDEVRTAIVGRFVQTRRQQAIDAWLASLRRRADVVDLYLPRTR